MGQGAFSQEHAGGLCTTPYRARLVYSGAAPLALSECHEGTEQILACFRYVSKKDVDANVVYVSRAYYDEDKQRNAFQCSGFNWISSDRPREGAPLFCKVRHGPSMYRCARQPEDSS